MSVVTSAAVVIPQKPGDRFVPDRIPWPCTTPANSEFPRGRPDPLRGRFTNPDMYEDRYGFHPIPVATTQALERIPHQQQGHQAWCSPMLVSQTRTSTRPVPIDACRSGSLAMHQVGQRSSSHAFPTVAFPGRADTVSHLSIGDGLT